jgi:RNA recognition motif-containing protein
MSVRLYVGNLPQSFDAKELEALFTSVGEGVRFKAVNDRDTGACRGFGFANVDDMKLAETVIEQLHGREFGGNSLRVDEEAPDPRWAGELAKLKSLLANQTVGV